MSHHISWLDGFTAYWTEDQPITRHVRQEMERDGLIKSLISQLQHNRQDIIKEVRPYRDLQGDIRDYLCVVRRYCPEISYPNDPSFIVAIRPNIVAYPWDAEGEVYTEIPEVFEEEVRGILVKHLINNLVHYANKKVANDK